LLITVNYGDLDIASLITPTIAQSEYVYREIVDIREADEFEICVPYINKQPFRSTIGAYDNVATLSITVLDALVAPATVTSNVYIMCELSGGSDLCFASPRPFLYTPIVPSAYQMSECLLASTNIGGTDVRDLTDVARSVTQGESCTSLRQLVKRYSPMTTTFSLAALVATNYVVPPFGSFIATSNGTVVAGNNTNVSSDIYTVLSTIYAFSRGGVRLAVVPLGSNTSQTITVAVNHVNRGAGNLTALITGATASLSNFLWNNSGNPLGYFQVLSPATYFIPQNTKFYHRINAYNYMTTTLPIGYSSYSDDTQFVVNENGAADLTSYVLRAGADDCSFSLFVSIPPFTTVAAPL
jgi:hypothetical protein